MKIVTITMNPVLDTSTAAPSVVPIKKTRCEPPVFEPGGGGINVSRALRKLGCDSLAIFIAGGKNGLLVQQLLENEKVNCRVIESEENTRENIMVMDRKSGEHYRFVMPGPQIKEDEWKQVYTVLNELSPKPEYIVASGSLPPGVPEDFYANIAQWANDNDIKMVIDTSGPALELTMKKGVFLAKPNLRELGEMLGKEKLTGMELDQAAKEFLSKGYSKYLVVSLAEKGALFARKNSLEYIIPPVMPVVSTVGAGDSMVAGILYGLTNGFWPEKAIRYGVAAGTAAVMTPGSELCKKSDTDKIFEWLNINRENIEL